MNTIKYLILIFILFFLSSLFADVHYPDKTFIKYKRGMVRVKKANGKILKARVGMHLEIGDTVKTLSNGHAIIVLAGTAIIKVKSNSTFIIPEDKKNKKKKVSIIKLLKGVIMAQAKKEKESLKVATPNAICGVRGTKFIVSFFNNYTRLIVTQGVVAFVPLAQTLRRTHKAMQGIRTLKARLVKAGQQVFYKAEISKTIKRTMKDLPTTPKADKDISEMFENAINEVAENIENTNGEFQENTEGLLNQNKNFQIKNIDKNTKELIESFENFSNIKNNINQSNIKKYIGEVIDNSATSDIKNENNPASVIDTGNMQKHDFGSINVTW